MHLSFVPGVPVCNKNCRKDISNSMNNAQSNGTLGKRAIKKKKQQTAPSPPSPALSGSSSTEESEDDDEYEPSSISASWSASKAESKQVTARRRAGSRAGGAGRYNASKRAKVFKKPAKPSTVRTSASSQCSQLSQPRRISKSSYPGMSATYEQKQLPFSAIVGMENGRIIWNKKMVAEGAPLW